MAKDFPYILDDQEYENDEKDLTANQILTTGGFDPQHYYLVEIVGDKHESFQGLGDKPINIKKNNVFVTVFFGTKVKEFDFRVDGEEYTSEEKKLSPNQILVKTGFDPAEYYLVELEGKKHHSYQGEGDKLINLKKENDFITVYTGPTTVSYEAKAGHALFSEQLEKMGYEVIVTGENEISFEYEVEVGKYAGRVVKHGLVISPSFPLDPPTGPHVSPHIHPITGGGVHPTGGVHPSADHSKSFKDGWQYWSRPCPNWANGPKNAAVYLAFIRSLWATQ